MQAESSAPQSFVALGYIRPLFKYLQAKGQSPEPYLQRLGLQQEQLSQFDLQCCDVAVSDMFEWAAERTGDANLGLHAGTHMHLANIGLIGQLVLTCGMARQVFELHARYYNLMGSGSVQTYEYGDDEVVIRLSRVPGLPNFSRQYYEFSLSTWATLARSIVGQQYNPSRVEFPAPGPADASEQEALFGCPVHYVATEEMRVYFPRAFADIELFSDEPELRQSLEMMASQRLMQLQGRQSDGDPLIARVKQGVSDRLMHGTPTMEQIAPQLDMSVRKLQRELSQRNQRFSELIDLVRKQQVERFLKDSELSLVDAALMLGFAEQSSFQRAFKRWFDVTPADYRRRLGVSSAAVDA